MDHVTRIYQDPDFEADDYVLTTNFHVHSWSIGSLIGYLYCNTFWYLFKLTKKSQFISTWYFSVAIWIHKKSLGFSMLFFDLLQILIWLWILISLRNSNSFISQAVFTLFALQIIWFIMFNTNGDFIIHRGWSRARWAPIHENDNQFIYGLKILFSYFYASFRKVTIFAVPIDSFAHILSSFVIPRLINHINGYLLYKIAPLAAAEMMKKPQIYRQFLNIFQNQQSELLTEHDLPFGVIDIIMDMCFEASIQHIANDSELSTIVDQYCKLYHTSNDKIIGLIEQYMIGFNPSTDTYGLKIYCPHPLYCNEAGNDVMIIQGKYSFSNHHQLSIQFIIDGSQDFETSKQLQFKDDTAWVYDYINNQLTDPKIQNINDLIIKNKNL